MAVQQKRRFPGRFEPLTVNQGIAAFLLDQSRRYASLLASTLLGDKIGSPGEYPACARDRY